MRPRRSGAFTLRQEGEATLIDITPARPDLAFMAAAVLLAGLFGLPALAIVLNPARHDALSLGAAACAAVIVALAVTALHRSLAGRGRRQLRLDSTGLMTETGLLPWPTLGERRVELPDLRQGQPASGIHALAANIAAQHRAAEAKVLQLRRDGQPPLSLASGLDAHTAAALREALDNAAARHAQ